MPELPEVETQRKILAKNIVGKTITYFSTDTPKTFYPGVNDFEKEILNQKIKNIARRGKFLVFELEKNKFMICHFRMTGHFLITKNKANFKNEKCVRAIFTLDNNWKLLYQDIRKFGKFWIGKKEDVFSISGINKLGPEPLEKSFTLKLFQERIRELRGTLKPLLLNQYFIVGIGNIYADESLFLANLHPLRKVENLTNSEIKKLHASIITSLKSGVKNNGTTIGEYVDPENKKGTNQDHLFAYGRKNLPCKKCKTKMSRIVVAQRGTVFCPKCQKN